MKCGSVVVASDRGAIPEVVDDAGILLSLDDFDSFILLITKLLTDKEFYEKYQIRGYNRSNLFSINNFILQYTKLYNV